MKSIFKTVDKFFHKDISEKDKSSIKSVFIINSLARGDFIEDVSDIDILLIFKKSVTMKRGALLQKKISKQLSSLLKEYKSSHFGEVIDIPWEIEERYDKSPINCFKWFFDDFKKHHILIYGEDIIKGLKLKPPTNSQRTSRIKELLSLINKTNNIKKHTLLTGAAIRQYLFTIGIKTLNKYEVIEKLKLKDFPEILQFYKDYIKNKTNSKKQKELNEKIIKKWLM